MILIVGPGDSLKRQHASQAAGFAAVAIGFAALIGWWAGLPLLSSWGSGLATMKPLAALCFAALGLALVHSGKDSRFAFTVGVAVATVALLDLGTDMLNVEPGIGRLQELETAVPGQGEVSFSVPHATALGLAFAAGSLAFSRFERHRLAATVLAILAGAVAVTILLGYLIEIVTPYGPAPVSAPALPTAVGLLFLVGGIVFRIGPTPTLRKPRPLSHLLFMLGCAIVVPLLLFGTFTGSRIADAQFHQIRKDLMNEARSLSADVDREIIGEIEKLQALAASPSLRHGDFAAFQSQAEASLSIRQSGNITLLDGNMRQLVNTSVPFGTPLPKAVVLKSAERALATGQPQTTGIFKGPVTEELTFGIVIPVKIDGESRYAIVRSPNPHFLAGLITANELPAGWYAVVSDATHRIITRSEQRDAFVGKELPPVQRQGPEAGGVFGFIDPAGRPSLQASVWSELTGWQTSVWAPTALLEAPVRALWWTIGLTALLAFTLVVAVALWLSRIIASSVSQTASAAIALGDGVPLPLSETPVAEVNTLITEFSRTAAKRWAAEGLLRESERRLRLAQEAAGLGAWEHDFTTGLAVWSDQLRNLIGLPPNEPASRESLFSRIHPDDRGKVERQIARACDPLSDHVYQAEFRVILPDRPMRWLEDRGRIEADAAGVPLRAFGVARDITARKEAEEAQARLAAIVTSSGDAIIGATLDGTVTTWNEAAERMFGYPAGEMIGQSIRRLIPADRQPEEDMILARVACGERIEHYETIRIAKDGRASDVSITASPMQDAEDRIVGASKIIRDITERKEAEQLLRRQADLLDQSRDAIFTWKIGGGITYWNRGAEELYGFTAAEAIGQSSHELLRTRASVPMPEVEAQIARDGSWYGELTHTTRDGRVIVVESRHVRVSYNGETYALETNRDITERKRTEGRLAEREAQLALFVEHAPAAIAMFDTDMVCLAASRRFLSDFRVPENVKVIGVCHYEVFPEIPPRWREVHRRVLAGEELSADEDSFLRPDGRTDWSRWSMKPWRTADGRIGGALLFTEVINAQVEASRALADSEARFRAMFENAAVGIAHVARDGRFLRVNDALCRILGYPADELVTKSFQDITHPDDLAADLAEVKGMLDGKIDRFDMDKRYLRKDGSIVWARLTVGGVYKSDGSIDYFVSVVEDISARKQAEQALQTSKDRLQFALDAARLGWWQYDPRSRTVWWDVRSKELFDVAEDRTDVQEFINRVHPDDIERVWAAVEAALDPTDPKPYATEYRVRSGVGEMRWVEAHGLAHFAGTGRERRAVILVGTAQDITERKQHEEKEHLLMGEINHRAKNMLSVVDAIAHQTAARNPEDFIERFSERIQALSANQDLLVRNEWRGVQIEDLVRAQLAHFVDLIGSRIAVQGAKLRLNPASAQAIGLAVHELATNAGKYGALSTDRGRVDISWGSDADTFTMSWTERDGPPVSPPQRRGFGIIVVEMMAERSVGGEVDLDYAPTGVTWRLTCPAANALEPGNVSQISGEREIRTDGATAISRLEQQPEARG